MKLNNGGPIRLSAHGTPKLTGVPSEKDEFVFIPLGGTGEIGMNFNIYGYGPANDRKYIVVDTGVMFTNGGQAEAVMADPTWLRQEVLHGRGELVGIFITHAHEDHVGAIGHLWPWFNFPGKLRVPVYATPFTATVARNKLSQSRLKDVRISEVKLGGKVKAGPFEVEYVTMTHSTIEPNALVISTPLGRVFHSGDWKIDPRPTVGDLTDEARIKRLGHEGVLAAVVDSTNVIRPGTAGSEAEVAATLEKLIADRPKGLIVVTCFASNLARVRSIALAAAKAGRTVAMVGKSLHRMVSYAQQAGYLKDLPKVHDVAKVFEKRLVNSLDELLLITTGSQGEEKTALRRIAEGSFTISVDGERYPLTMPAPEEGKEDEFEGSHVIFSSNVIPGNSEAVRELQEMLAAQHCNIIKPDDADMKAIGPLHVSGHPCQDDLQALYGWVKPKLAIPVHGEPEHLDTHATFATDVGVPASANIRNGDMVNLVTGAITQKFATAPRLGLFPQGFRKKPEIRPLNDQAA